MKLPRYARVLLAIGSGAALGLAFPNYNFYLLAWVAMGMLVLASAGAPLKEAAAVRISARAGFLSGVLAVGRYGDAPVRDIDPSDPRCVCGTDWIYWRFDLHGVCYGRGAGFASEQIAGLRDRAVFVDFAGIFSDECPDHRVVVGSFGISGGA